ncbi:MAG TPA: RNA 2',3'-cyclic phosphodiesterase [Thermoplasmata archaeon]|jgi:RNA 2',3'-cyclic 3'-phosphodiesterase|nr:MAG TPA: RNA 2',3'-cyclic phosphodiesterase [Thermoplasmata archaeon]
MSTFRGFIAIDIVATPQMITFEKEIAKTGADVKLVEPENIHITVKFLGDTNENHIDAIEQSMKESVRALQSFPITLKGTGVFPNQNYMKVIWIGIIDEGIIKTIAQAIDNTLVPLGFKKENRGFSPHLTIGRVKTARKKDRLLEVISNYNEVEFTIQKVQSIILKKSELTPKGPIYSNLREVPL